MQELARKHSSKALLSAHQTERNLLGSALWNMSSMIVLWASIVSKEKHVVRTVASYTSDMCHPLIAAAGRSLPVRYTRRQRHDIRVHGLTKLIRRCQLMSYGRTTVPAIMSTIKESISCGGLTMNKSSTFAMLV